MDTFWNALGFGALLALALHGWPRLFTINIHKHYHGTEDAEK